MPDHLIDFSNDLSDLMYNAGIPATVWLRTNYYLARNDYSICGEVYTIRAFFVDVDKMPDDLESDIWIILAVLETESPKDINLIPVSTRLYISWNSTEDASEFYSYPLFINSELRNAIAAYREGLEGEALLEAFGGLTYR